MAPIAGALAERSRDSAVAIEPVHLHDESLYIDYAAAGGLTTQLCDRVARLLQHSADCGAEAILFTGSLFSPAVEAARETMEIPVFTAYQALIERALDRQAQRGSGILVMASLQETLDGVAGDFARQAGLRAAVAGAGREGATRFPGTHPGTHLIPGAFAALRQGDRDRHDRIVADEVLRVAGEDPRGSIHDPIVLAQFSLSPVRARLPPEVQERVLTSAGCAADALIALLARRDGP